MWKQSGLWRCWLSGLLLLLSSGSLRANTPLTEAEVRAWAAGKDSETLTNALVTVSLEAEKLNLLLIEERRDWLEYKAEVTKSLDGVRDEIKTAREASVQSATSFEKALQTQAASMTQIKMESLGWKVAAGVATATALFFAVR